MNQDKKSIIKARHDEIMQNEQFEWMSKSIETIKSGLVNKMISPDNKVTMYRCGTIIRIDIKP